MKEVTLKDKGVERWCRVPHEDFWLDEEKNAMKSLKICYFIKGGA